MRHAWLALGLTLAGCAGVDDVLEGRWSVTQTDDPTPLTRDGAVVLLHGDGTFYAAASYWASDGCLARQTTTGTWRTYPGREIVFRGLEATYEACDTPWRNAEPFAELVYTYELGLDLTLRGEYTATVLERR